MLLPTIILFVCHCCFQLDKIQMQYPLKRCNLLKELDINRIFVYPFYRMMSTNNNKVSELNHEQGSSRGIFSTTRTSHYFLPPKWHTYFMNNRHSLNRATPHNQSSGVIQGVLSLAYRHNHITGTCGDYQV